MSAYGGSRSTRLLELVYATYESRCHLCGEWINEDDRSVDHVIARSHGGTDDISNCKPAHKVCNSSRGNRPIEEWRSQNTNELNWLISLVP